MKRRMPSSAVLLVVLSAILAPLALERRHLRAEPMPPPDDLAGDVMARLTAEHINRVRFMELRAAREPNINANNIPIDRVTVVVPTEVTQRFLASVLGDREFRGDAARRRFLAMTPPQKLSTIAYWVRDTEDEFAYADAVRIERDPTILIEYKRRIQPILMNGCATSACHGNPDTSRTRMRLYNDPRRQDRSLYANFITLRQWEVDHRLLVNRDKPDESLLLTYTLPPDQTRFAHPAADGFKPLYLRDDAPGYRLIRRWISQLRSLHPERGYGFRLVPRTPGATQPTDDLPPDAP